MADIKPDNILVNYGTDTGSVGLTDVQLPDFGSTVPVISKHAEEGDLIGAPIWCRPEAHLRFGWSIPTDIWSFGTIVCVQCVQNPLISVLLTYILSLSH